MKDYQLGVYEKSMPEELDWRERLSIAKECGFDFLELSIDETDQRLARLEWTLEERLELLNLTKKLGMPIRSICLSGHRRYPLGHKDLEMQKRSLEIGYKAVDFASDLGIRIIQLAGYDVYYDEGDAETEQNFAKNLRLMTEYAASKEVTLGFETMETPFMDTVEKAMHYVNLIQNAWLGVYPDIGNLTNAAKIYKN
ncbi:MAG: L-ribulose-5-phosphate 3-epimerase, partial [Clostridiaceae bacterium]|nr:L-ribulose-5-phosphate 3-epimerase [Clostridiaceae bacterium]